MRSLRVGIGSKFLLTGIIVNITLFFSLECLLRFGVDYRVGTTAIFILGMVWSYIQNRLWSWQSKAPIAKSVWRFIAVYAVIYVAHMGLVMLLVEWVGFLPILAVLLSVAVLVIPIFIAFDRLVFKDSL